MGEAAWKREVAHPDWTVEVCRGVWDELSRDQRALLRVASVGEAKPVDIGDNMIPKLARLGLVTTTHNADGRIVLHLTEKGSVFLQRAKAKRR